MRECLKGLPTCPTSSRVNQARASRGSNAPSNIAAERPARTVACLMSFVRNGNPRELTVKPSRWRSGSIVLTETQRPVERTLLRRWRHSKYHRAMGQFSVDPHQRRIDVQNPVALLHTMSRVHVPEAYQS